MTTVWKSPDNVQRTPDSVACLLRHEPTNTLHERALIRVTEDDVDWRFADDNSELSHEWHILAWRDKDPIKDHEVSLTVSALLQAAIEFTGTQQLRARLAGIVVPMLKRADTLFDKDTRVQVAQVEAVLKACLHHAHTNSSRAKAREAIDNLQSIARKVEI